MEHVARILEKRNAYKISLANLKERDDSEDQEVDEIIILKRLLRK